MKKAKFVFLDEYICVLWMIILTAHKFEYLGKQNVIIEISGK
jgi:hypothetical protein